MKQELEPLRGRSSREFVAAGEEVDTLVSDTGLSELHLECWTLFQSERKNAVTTYWRILLKNLNFKTKFLNSPPDVQPFFERNEERIFHLLLIILWFLQIHCIDATSIFFLAMFFTKRNVVKINYTYSTFAQNIVDLWLLTLVELPARFLPPIQGTCSWGANELQHDTSSYERNNRLSARTTSICE